jgi:protein-S-isoprenylcysteine O-methyltransferase Ste14
LGTGLCTLQTLSRAFPPNSPEAFFGNRFGTVGFDATPRWNLSTMKNLELKFPPVVWVLGCAMCMWACKVWLPDFDFDLRQAQALGGLVASMGLSISVSGVLTFRKARTTVNPMHPGRANSLVRSGPYRFTRNPMYLGMFFVLSGWFLFLHNLAALVFLGVYVAVITEFQIRPEERFMAELFGEQYEEYKREVPRWLGATG